jgi:hypothetical protein
MATRDRPIEGRGTLQVLFKLSRPSMCRRAGDVEYYKPRRSNTFCIDLQMFPNDSGDFELHRRFSNIFRRANAKPFRRFFVAHVRPPNSVLYVNWQGRSHSYPA